jgi:hypothetical protein
MNPFPQLNGVNYPHKHPPYLPDLTEKWKKNHCHERKPSPYRVKLCLPVFTPPLNTLWRVDLNKNIPDSIRNCDGVKVLSGFQGGE